MIEPLSVTPTKFLIDELHRRARHSVYIAEGLPDSDDRVVAWNGENNDTLVGMLELGKAVIIRDIAIKASE